MKRQIISIDEELCSGCGQCIPACPEGAIQLIDGKARLVGDLRCDGLGACVGHCPEGAMRIEEREAEPYDEELVIAAIAAQGEATVAAHLEHLRSHGQDEYLDIALRWLHQHGHAVPSDSDSVAPAQAAPRQHVATACPGARAFSFTKEAERHADEPRDSALRHWPVQLHLANPAAAHYRGAHLLLAADCSAFAMGDFHQRWLAGKALAIACPKLDEGQERYIDKLVAMIDEARIETLSVMIMQVPCCRGLLSLAQAAAGRAQRVVPIKLIVVSPEGEVTQETWLAHAA